MVVIQRADPRARRLAGWTVAVVLALAAVVVAGYRWFEGDIEAWLERNIAYLVQHSIIVFFICLALVSPVLAMCAYLYVLGNRVVSAGRFPPPGHVVARDAVVVEGDAAVRRGRLVQFVALIVLACAGVIPFFIWYLFRSLALLDIAPA